MIVAVGLSTETGEGGGKVLAGVGARVGAFVPPGAGVAPGGGAVTTGDPISPPSMIAALRVYRQM